MSVKQLENNAAKFYGSASHIGGVISIIHIHSIGHSATVWNGKFQRNKLQVMAVAVKKVTCRYNILFDFKYHFD